MVGGRAVGRRVVRARAIGAGRRATVDVRVARSAVVAVRGRAAVCVRVLGALAVLVRGRAAVGVGVRAALAGRSPTSGRRTRSAWDHAAAGRHVSQAVRKPARTVWILFRMEGLLLGFGGGLRPGDGLLRARGLRRRGHVGSSSSGGLNGILSAFAAFVVVNVCGSERGLELPVGELHRVAQLERIVDEHRARHIGELVVLADPRLG